MLHKETSSYTTAYRRPAVFLLLTDFPIMSNWKHCPVITNTHHILQYCCHDIVTNNIYTQLFIQYIISYTYLSSILFNAELGYPKPIQR